MGFPVVCYCIAVPKTLIAFCKLLSVIRDAVLLMLAVVGLCRSPHDGARRSVDAPQPEEVKNRLPAVEYGQLVAELSSPASPSTQHASCHHGGGEAAASSTCIVCLERLEATDEVRRLGSCAHAFHRGCIDRWIDLGRLTCPLCRSNLLPRARGGPLGFGRLASLLTRVR
ncbi:brassinosteroid-responsive RING protein 1-like [Phragmites australis]|uniref:brassinosteroid-responsive RING protein 1-like n=1 Tax=Phragmites australis TaxID=29695 RepID=UPI002D76A1C9|nr:brassinosteroid-responsive RING protein 1-like [Phragmites australis]